MTTRQIAPLRDGKRAILANGRKLYTRHGVIINDGGRKVSKDEQMERSRVRTIPPHAHPYVKRLFSEMRALGLTYQEVARRSGTAASTIIKWRHEKTPHFTNLEAALNVVGLTLVVVKLRKGNHGEG